MTHSYIIPGRYYFIYWMCLLNSTEFARRQSYNYIYAPCMHGYTAAWVHGCMGIRLHGYTAAWVYGCMGIQLHGYTAAWVYGYTAAWVYGYTAAWVYGCIMLFKLHRYTRLHGYTAAWVYSCMGIRLHGYTAIRLHGYIRLYHGYIRLFKLHGIRTNCMVYGYTKRPMSMCMRAPLAERL